MKKKTNIIFFLLSVLLFSFIYIYTETSIIKDAGYLDYHLLNFLGYILWWAFTLFVLSVLAYKLDSEKYRAWLLSGTVTSLVSLFIAYGMGSGSSDAIVDIDGELTTWFFVGLYSFISIIYFIFQFFKKRAD